MQYQTHEKKRMRTAEELSERLEQIDQQVLDKISLFMEKKLIYEGGKEKSKECSPYIEMKVAKENLRDLYVERSLLLWILGV